MTVPRTRPAKRSPLGMTIGILVAVFIVGVAVARLVTDKLWFDSLNFTGVFWTRLISQLSCS